MSDKLSPGRAVRLLRAKAAELEHKALAQISGQTPLSAEIGYINADIALVAQLLADHIERSPGPSGPELGDE